MQEPKIRSIAEYFEIKMRKVQKLENLSPESADRVEIMLELAEARSELKGACMTLDLVLGHEYQGFAYEIVNELIDNEIIDSIQGELFDRENWRFS